MNIEIVIQYILELKQFCWSECQKKSMFNDL